MLIIRQKNLLGVFIFVFFICYLIFYLLAQISRYSQPDQVYIDMGDFKPNKSYVFIDLGANNGDSLANFFHLENSAPVRFHLSDKRHEISWKVFAFEANPLFTAQLLKLKASLSTMHRIHIYNGTAAWTRNGYIDFYLDTVNTKRQFWGSSLKKTHPDVVRSGKRKIKVPCVDIAELVHQFTADDFVFMKIDIEGAEYDLLLHLLKSGALNLIDFLAVEYHPDAVGIYSSSDAFNYVLKTASVKHFKWY
jgi:FkbM family methyltransferase